MVPQSCDTVESVVTASDHRLIVCLYVPPVMYLNTLDLPCGQQVESLVSIPELLLCFHLTVGSF